MYLCKSQDKRLIIVLNNCALTVDHVLPRLIDSFDKHGYPDINRVQMVCWLSCCLSRFYDTLAYLFFVQLVYLYRRDELREVLFWGQSVFVGWIRLLKKWQTDFSGWVRKQSIFEAICISF